MSLIKLKDFSVKYKNQSKKVLSNINLNFPDNKISIITGPSGSGKSTLLKFISGLYPNFSPVKITENGIIKIDNTNIKELSLLKRRKLIAMMLQNPNQQFITQVVFDEMVFVLENLQTPANQIKDRINDALKLSNIIHLKNRLISTLSSGEKQRLALAILLAINPKIMLLDEPFSNIDPKNKTILLKRLIKLKNKTLIIVDHNVSEYKNITHKTFFVNDNHIIDYAPNNFKNKKENNENIKSPFKLPNESSAKLITIKNLLIKNGKNNNLIKQNNFNFYPGATLITGQSGVGKTTFFNSISKINPYQGTISLEDKNIKKITNKKYFKNVSLIFQNPQEQFLKPFPKEEIKLALKYSLNPNYWTQEKITNVLNLLQLSSHLDTPLVNLSAGEQKKLQILIMLIRGTKLILLDEPFSSLDDFSLKQVIKLLKNEILNHKHSLLVISHQTDKVKELFDYHVNLANKQLTYSTT